MAICFFLSVCLLTGLHKHYWLELHEKNEKMGFGQT